jgi:pilus assembly protein CpaC
VLGKSLGSTSLTLYGPNKSLIAVMDLVVTPDLEGLKARLFELMPSDEVEVRGANTALILSGTVSSATNLSRVLALAAQYAGGKDNVTNLLNVKGSQQVMLHVKFAEVSRSLSKALGFNFNILNDDFFFSSGDGLLTAVTGFATGGVTSIGLGGGTTLTAFFDALEEKGIVKTLAEPNLIALSGDTASFLAGGEFPVPVAQDVDGGDSTVTVEFKDFGVSLAFTPTVLEDGLMNIVVSPEVSAIDPTTSTTVNGLTIPGLTVRRATTTVELRDGQSFAIAGLIQSDFQDTVTQLPWVGDIPVIGALFRSSEFQRDETELVIIVTPRLIQPSPAGSLAAPTDNFVPPSDTDLFLFGRTEAPESGTSEGQGGYDLSAQAAGGIEGTYGHIIK